MMKSDCNERQAMLWVEIPADPKVVGATAFALFTGGGMIAQRLRVPPAYIHSPQKMVPILEAASMVCEKANGEGLTIRLIARRNEDDLSAHEWFARSLLSIVPVYRKVDSDTFEKLDLPDDGFEYRVLHVRKRDIRAYLRWARTLH